MTKIPCDDELMDVMRTGSARAAAALENMLELPVSLYFNALRFMPSSNIATYLQSEMGESGAAVLLKFDGDCFYGNAFFVLPQHQETALLEHICAKNQLGSEAQAAGLNILEEIGNVILNICVGTLSNQIGCNVTFSPPETFHKEPDAPMLSDIIKVDAQLFLLVSRLMIGSIEVEPFIFLVIHEEEIKEQLF